MITFTPVAEGLQFPEGPIAMTDGSVLLVEIRRQTLTRVWPDGGTEVIAELGGGPNGAAIGPDGKVYVCNNGGFSWHDRPDGVTVTSGPSNTYTHGYIQQVDIATGSVVTLYESCGGTPLRGPNDIVFDRDGGFWFSDFGKNTEQGILHGALCYARTDGSRIVRAKERMVTPNGVGFSPDGTIIYVAESLTGRLWAYEVEGPGTVKVSAALKPARLVATLPDYQLFDSLAVQSDGRVYVATLVSGGISIINPVSGAVEFHKVPDEPYVTNICFGGPDMRDAWITGSGRGKLFHARWPVPGLPLTFGDHPASPARAAS